MSTQESSTGDDASAPPVPTLFERLGGSAAVEAAVYVFYNRIIADAELAPFFEGVDVKKLHRKQVIRSTINVHGHGCY